MYQAHFGLKKPLFESGIAQDAAVFLAPKHELIIANTKVALTTLDSTVVLTGTAGVGKTTLISSALRTTSTRLALGWITGAPVNGAELLELLLVEFGFNAHRVGRVERMQMWRQFLNEMSATESRVFVIVERADDLSHEVLRALDSLTAVDPNGCLGANLLLLGQPALLEHLKAPALESLRQRIRLRERLEPLTPDELRAYLAQQVTRAGGSFDKVFAPNAVATLHELSAGIPRIANNLCETALTLAATGAESLLTPDLLTRIAVAMFGMDVPRAASAPATAAAAQTAPAPAATVAPKHTAAPAAREAAAQVSVAPAPIASATFASPTTVAFAPPTAPIYAPLPPRAQSEIIAPQAAIVAPTAVAAAAPVAAQAAPATPPAAALLESAQPARTLAPPPRSNPPIVTRSAATTFPKPPHERDSRPTPTAQTSFPPVIPSRARSPAPRPVPESEIDSFADTLTDTPDVQMPDLPVLTDAVESPTRSEKPRTRAEMAYTRDAPPARTPVATPSRPAPAQSASRTAPPVPSAPPAAPAPASAPRAAGPPPTPAGVTEEELLHQTQTVRALAAAKSIDDISSSMAETLFAEADLDMLSAALGAAGWPEPAADLKSEQTSPKPAPKKAAAEPKRSVDEDPFDLFGLGPDAPLELIDDSTPTDEHGRKAVSNR